MPRKPPLLAVMDGDGPPEDRRKVYERKMRRDGNRKLTVWVHEALAEDLRAAAAATTDPELRHEAAECIGRVASSWRLSRP